MPNKKIKNSPPSLFDGSDVIELTDDDFDFNDGTKQPTLKMNKPGLVMFFSSMCPHCASKGPDYKELAKHLNSKDGYQIYSVHTMDPATNKIGQALQIQFIPTFYETDAHGNLTPYDEEFRKDTIMDRANTHNMMTKKHPTNRFVKSLHSQYMHKGIVLPSIKTTIKNPYINSRANDLSHKTPQIGGGCGCKQYKQGQYGGYDGEYKGYKDNHADNGVHYCNGITKSGQRCRSKSGLDSDFCWRHQ